MSRFRIFDFDDTLVKSDAKIVVTSKDGTVKELTPGHFAIYEPKPGDKFEFRDFDVDIKNPRPIKYYINILKTVLKGGGNVIILTARSNPGPIAKFLRDIGITSGVTIATQDSADPAKKRNYIERLITDKGATEIEFFDDSVKFIEAVNTLKKKYPNVKIRTRRVPKYHR